MSNEIKTTNQQETVPLEEIPITNGEIVESEPNFDHLIPQMNVNVPQEAAAAEPIIKAETILGIYDEILDKLRKEHENVTEYIDNFAEMVINQGDCTTSSKEALVNLIKIRTDIPNSMTRVADLMTRVALKDRDTYKPYLTANQTNNVVIGDGTGERRSLLDAIKKAKKKG